MKRVQRLVMIDIVHAFALNKLGLGFSFLERNDGLAQLAELLDRREIGEAGGTDCCIDSGVFLISECVHEVGELPDVGALAVKEDSGKSRFPLISDLTLFQYIGDRPGNSHLGDLVIASRAGRNATTGLIVRARAKSDLQHF